MALTDEQASIVKTQLIDHISKTFPDDKKDLAIEQIEAMGAKELEEFVKQNNLIQNGNGAPPEIFRQIVEGKIPSYWVDENEHALAVLEINPVSKGHVIIIPKIKTEEESEISKAIYELAKNVEKKISSILNPIKVETIASKALGEIIINVIPSYNGENIKSERKSASKEELEALKEQLSKTEKKKIIKKSKPKKISGEKIRLPRRIP